MFRDLPIQISLKLLQFSKIEFLNSEILFRLFLSIMIA